MRYRAPAPGKLITETVEAFTLVYDRRSGQTHMLASPMPEILMLLAHGPVDVAELGRRLGDQFDLGRDDPAPLLAARLEELAALGLAERLP